MTDTIERMTEELRRDFRPAPGEVGTGVHEYAQHESVMRARWGRDFDAEAFRAAVAAAMELDAEED